MSSNIIKITAITQNANNTISLPPNNTNYNITNYNNYLVSYNQLEDIDDSSVRSSLKRFLTTDCITDSTTETSKSKVLSCYGVNQHINRINSLIDGSAISYLGSLTGEYASDPVVANNDVVYNLFDGTIFSSPTLSLTTGFGDTFLASDTDDIDDISTNFTEWDATTVTAIKILLPAIYRINYEIYTNIDTDDNDITTLFRMYRVISVDDTGTLYATHHNKLFDSSVDWIDETTESNNQSYLIGATEGDLTVTATIGTYSTAVNYQKGSVIVHYDPPSGVQEYLIFGLGTTVDAVSAPTFNQVPLYRITFELIHAL